MICYLKAEIIGCIINLGGSLLDDFHVMSNINLKLTLFSPPIPVALTEGTSLMNTCLAHPTDHVHIYHHAHCLSRLAVELGYKKQDTKEVIKLAMMRGPTKVSLLKDVISLVQEDTEY